MFSLAGAFAVSEAGTICAAVPERVILGWQKSAPEALEITVLSVDGTSTTRAYGTLPGGSVTTTNVIMTGKVDVVHRTATELVPGSEIVVRYEITRFTPPPGPPDGNRGIVLHIGKRVAAYLKQSHEKTFNLACAVGCLSKL